MRMTLLGLLFLTSCSGVQTKQRADGTYSLECGERKACLDRADRLCGGEGYIVVGGESHKKLYGVPGNAKMVGKDELYIRCNKDRPKDSPDLQTGTWRLPKRESNPRPAPSTLASPKPVAAKVCRPGETQRCVGPGACDGGQACLADGTGFGPCDCGPSPSAAKPPADGSAPAPSTMPSSAP